MNGLRSITGRDNKFFTFPHLRDRICVQLGLLSNGYYGLFPGVIRSEREADFLSPSSAEFKNNGTMSLVQNNSSLYGA